MEIITKEIMIKIPEAHLGLSSAVPVGWGCLVDMWHGAGTAVPPLLF